MLVMQCGYDPEYVLDKIETYELNAAMKYSYYAVKDEWEQARLIAYMVAQTHSRKTLKMQDILTFHWENEQNIENTKITKEEIEQLKKQAQQYLKHNTTNTEKRN